MNPFQAIGVPVSLILLAITLVAASRGIISSRVGLAWSTVWLLAAAAIAWPGMTSGAARLLGIGRGADLILYCAIICMMIGFFVMYVRYRKVEEEITTLVRHIAMMEIDGSRLSSSVGGTAGEGE